MTAALRFSERRGTSGSGLASPYLNAEIKKYTEGDTQANLIAHALLGAVVKRLRQGTMYWQGLLQAQGAKRQRTL